MSAMNLTNNETDFMVDYLNLKKNVNDFFLVICGTLILFMQAGFAFLEAGSIRVKNVTNILIKNILDLCLGFLAFCIFGYGLCFGEGNIFVGGNYFFTINVPTNQYSHLFFQSTFAATCATIVSGAVAERIDFYGYMIYAVVLTGLIYPIGTRWAWGPTAWLTENGFSDFAGGGVVHMAGGVCALIGVIFLGPRAGRFKPETASIFVGHSTPLVALGTFIIIAGFMVFNAGSNATISNIGDGQAVAQTTLVTLAGCSTGGLITLIFYKFVSPPYTWSFFKTTNGCIAGMVSVCAAANELEIFGTLIVATTSSFAYFGISALMVKLKLDDPLDAIAVHGGGGMCSLLLGPVVKVNGAFSGNPESLQSLIWNLIGAGIIISWYASCSILLFGGLKSLGLLRVELEKELLGQDEAKHKEKSYVLRSPQVDISLIESERSKPNSRVVPITGQPTIVYPMNINQKK